MSVKLNGGWFFAIPHIFYRASQVETVKVVKFIEKLEIQLMNFSPSRDSDESQKSGGFQRQLFGSKRLWPSLANHRGDRCIDGYQFASAHDLKRFKTNSTFQMKPYFGRGGLRFATPDIRLETLGCCPTGKPSIGSW